MPSTLASSGRARRRGSECPFPRGPGAVDLAGANAAYHIGHELACLPSVYLPYTIGASRLSFDPPAAPPATQYLMGAEMKARESATGRPTVDVDVAIVGGGMAGLVAAHRLAGYSVALLEAGARAGGRAHSVAMPGGPVNLGAHMVPTRGTVVGALVEELGLPANPVPQRLFALHTDGRTRLGTPPALLPALLPFSAAERVAFIRAGIALRLGAWRSVQAARPRPGERTDAARARVLAFEDERTLAAYLGALPPRVAALIRALTERNGADPSEMSAGHGLRSFANVWAKTAPGSNLVSGTSALPDALAARLANRILTDWRVTSAVPVRGPGRPFVRLTGATADGRPLSLDAKTCILAVPAPVALRIAEGLGPAAEQALGQIRYGPFLSLGLTLETAEALPWQDTYAIATPGLPFSVLFNHDRMRPDLGRDGMHSMMLFRGARGAADEMAEPDDTIVARWIAALESDFPVTRGLVRSARLMRWPLGAPFAAPGRAALEVGLEGVAHPFALAGDYLEFPNMEAAAQSGVRAAETVVRWLHP